MSTLTLYSRPPSYKGEVESGKYIKQTNLYFCSFKEAKSVQDEKAVEALQQVISFSKPREVEKIKANLNRGKSKQLLIYITIIYCIHLHPCCFSCLVL